MKSYLTPVLALLLTLFATAPGLSATAVLQADIRPASDTGKSTDPVPTPRPTGRISGKPPHKPCGLKKRGGKHGDRKHWHHRKHGCKQGRYGHGRGHMARRLDLIEARLAKIETMLEKLLMRD